MTKGTNDRVVETKTADYETKSAMGNCTRSQAWMSRR
jgi:hypothetical protein